MASRRGRGWDAAAGCWRAPAGVRTSGVRAAMEASLPGPRPYPLPAGLTGGGAPPADSAGALVVGKPAADSRGERSGGRTDFGAAGPAGVEGGPAGVGPAGVGSGAG